jgi:hypothetical protein
MNRHTMQVLSVCVALFLSQVPKSAAQDQPPKARITITLFATDRAGVTRARAASSDDISIKGGESRKAHFWGSRDGGAVGVTSDTGAGEGSAVSSGGSTDGGEVNTGAVVGGAVGGNANIGGGSSGAGRSGFGAVKGNARGPFGQTDQYFSWDVEVRLASTNVDSVTLDLDWHRSENDDGKTRVASGDHRTITLRQGDRHVLDFVSCSPAESHTANLLVEFQAAPVEDPAFAGVNLGYDLWLVQSAGDGSKSTRHLALTGRQGEKVPFKFMPVMLPLEAQARAEADSPLKMLVDGTITGRMAPDGTIQVALQPNQSFRLMDEPHGGMGSGTKIFTMKAGETINLELPDRSGYSIGSIGAGKIANPAAGVKLMSDGRVIIDFKQLLAEAKTSILLTVQRQ